jgi:hypothetical protein
LRAIPVTARIKIVVTAIRHSGVTARHAVYLVSWAVMRS